jgi:hypothetical protein
MAVEGGNGFDGRESFIVTDYKERGGDKGGVREGRFRPKA